MSYSFDLRRPSKDELKIAIRDKMAAVAVEQPVHVADLHTVVSAAVDAISLVSDSAAEGKDVFIRVNGYISGAWKGTELHEVHSVSINLAVSLANRV